MNNFNKLRGRIKEKLGTENIFAKKIGISAVSLSSRFAGRTFFTVDEIQKACKEEVLDIPKEEISEYFF